MRQTLSTTGEMTLHARMLPIGGLKEKSLAAHRAGIRTVIVPEDNAKDLEEVPKSVGRAVKFHVVEHIDEVLKYALALDDPNAFFQKTQHGGPAASKNNDAASSTHEH